MKTFLTIISIIAVIIVPLLVIYFSLKFIGVAYAPVVFFISLAIVALLGWLAQVIARVVKFLRNNRKSR